MGFVDLYFLFKLTSINNNNNNNSNNDNDDVVQKRPKRSLVECKYRRSRC